MEDAGLSLRPADDWRSGGQRIREGTRQRNREGAVASERQGAGSFTCYFTPNGFTSRDISPFDDDLGGDFMSSGGDPLDLTVDGYVGSRSVDTVIEEQGRSITDRARGGPR